MDGLDLRRTSVTIDQVRFENDLQILATPISRSTVIKFAHVFSGEQEANGSYVSLSPQTCHNHRPLACGWFSISGDESIVFGQILYRRVYGPFSVCGVLTIFDPKVFKSRIIIKVES